MEENIEVKIESGNQLAMIHTLNNKNEEFGMEEENVDHMKQRSSECVRKSMREKKTPLHLINSIVDMNAIGETLQKRIFESDNGNRRDDTEILNKLLNRQKETCRNSMYPNFKCDHCGSRYVINPMKRKNGAPRARATPRHKIDPETQKVLTLCNACGLKFSRPKKGKQSKQITSEEDQKKFLEEGERFAKELAEKLDNEAAGSLFCSSVKKNVCGCIQKHIVGQDGSTVDEILERAKDILDTYLKAIELKKQKCYQNEILDTKPGKKNVMKIGLGNGHRKSKEYEDFVLPKRKVLRNSLNFCEKATQKILSYSNNFLHKRMKTDPDKGFRIERKKGKAALGMLHPIQDLPNSPCCIDNCVRMALTHGRLLEVWRERATSSQLEARRVIAEMLTPSGGNRANCYRFVCMVTGCSHSTIGKVNEQMKITGGDREPPEHGLKKYWKDKPKAKLLTENMQKTKFIPSYEILQTAANSAGLATMIECIPEGKTVEPVLKKMKRQPSKTPKGASKKNKNVIPPQPDGVTHGVNIIADNGVQGAAGLQNIQAVIAYPNGGYFTIPPTGLAASNTIAIPNAVSLHTMQQQVAQQQHQQNLEYQIQILQQQLQNSQSARLAQSTSLASITENDKYVVNVSNGIGHNSNVQSIGPSVVVVSSQDISATPQASDVTNITQPLVSDVTNNESCIPSIVSYSPVSYTDNIGFVSSSENIDILQSNIDTVHKHQTVPLLTPTVAERKAISMLPQNNGGLSVITPQNTLAETSVIGVCATAPIESMRQVHLVTSQSPTMAALTQPGGLSLQTPSISLSSLPTMLLANSTTNELKPSVIQAPIETPNISLSSLPTMMLAQSSSTEEVKDSVQAQSLPDVPTMLLSQSTSIDQNNSAFHSQAFSNLPAMILTQSTSTEHGKATLHNPSLSNLPTMLLTTSGDHGKSAIQKASLSNLPSVVLTQPTLTEQAKTALQNPELPTMLLAQTTSSDPEKGALQTPSLSSLPTMLFTHSSSMGETKASLQAPSLSNLPTMIFAQATSAEQEKTSLQTSTLPNMPTLLLTQPVSSDQKKGTLQTSLSNLRTMFLTPSATNDQRQAPIRGTNLPTMILTQSTTSNEQTQAAAMQASSISLSSLPAMLLTQSASNCHQVAPGPQFILQQTSASDQLVLQRPLFSQSNTEHIVVKGTIPTVHSNTEQKDAISSSFLPPMSGFSDGFITNSNGTLKYNVLNTSTLSPSHAVMDGQTRQLDPNNTIQMPFLQS